MIPGFPDGCKLEVASLDGPKPVEMSGIVSNSRPLAVSSSDGLSPPRCPDYSSASRGGLPGFEEFHGQWPHFAVLCRGSAVMRIRDLFQSKSFVMSIEVFPPKTEAGDEGLYRALERLRQYDPAFVSCTYGAGGSTQNRTVEICRRIQTDFAVPATSHFTCVGATREELLDWLALATRNGIANIMALRGDPPQGQAEFSPVEGGLTHANELVALIREHYPHMGIGVAGYPEKHPEAPSLDVDLDNLKRKVDAGADAVFTQLFYANENFLKFRDRCVQAGIEIPIIPGIMPITEFARIKRITAMCGALFPASLAARLEAVQTDPQAQFEIGVEFAIEQCQALIAAGVPGMHFYVLNKSESCERILAELGMKSGKAVE